MNLKKGQVTKKLWFDKIQRTSMDFCSLWVFTAMSDYKTL